MIAFTRSSRLPLLYTAIWVWWAPANTVGFTQVSVSHHLRASGERAKQACRHGHRLILSTFLSHLLHVCKETDIYDLGSGHSWKGRRTELKERHSRLTGLNCLFAVRLSTSAITPKVAWLECQMRNKTQRMCMRLVPVSHGALLWALGIKENEPVRSAQTSKRWSWAASFDTRLIL